ncbi:MAG: hypothetical protein H0V47_10305 [Chloroflexia bacterium]|jgi:arsenate reductase|nr:hypothetical protein [Chloroflexia bacterium]
MGVTPRDVLSTRSRAYQARRDEIERFTAEELIQEMVAEPTLIRRPLLVGNGAHAIGGKKSDLAQFIQETEG